MKFKLESILLIVFLLLMVMNAVSAGDNSAVGTEDGKLMLDSDSAVLAENANDINVKLSATNSQNTLQSGEVGNYTELQRLIDSNLNGVITLDKDYAYFDSEANLIYVDGPITINGNGHNISGENKAMSFFVNSVNNVVLNNITFLNGNKYTMVWINGNNCLVDNCSFEDNSATSYGALRFAGQNNIVKNSNFTNNNVNYGSAVLIAGNYNSVYNCTFENNGAGYYGGAICINNCNNNIINCSTFKGNKGNSGGAVYIYGSNNVVDNSTFSDNNGSSGGAVYIYGGQKNKVLNATFTNNAADNPPSFSLGGAIFVNSQNCIVDECKFEDNHADFGGAVYMNYINGVINNSRFNHNYAGMYGGAVYSSDYADNVIINNSIFNENSIDNSESRGAAVYVDVANNVKILNSEFNKHNAQNGSAVYWLGTNGTVKGSTFNENNATSYGGAIFWDGENGTIEDNDFNNNHAADRGGAIYVQKPNLLINDSRFSENAADKCAGAIYISTDNVTVIRSEFNQNHAKEAGAIEIFGRNNTIESSTFNDNNATEDSEYGIHGGGAILISQPEMYSNELLNNTIRASTFNRNGARAGGAILITSKGNTINGSKFYYNSAIFGGAVNLNYADNNVIDDSLFEHNTASEQGGALHIELSDNNLVNNTHMNSNNATEGGAIYVSLAYSQTATVNNSYFGQNAVYNNRADKLASGGAISWFANNGTIDNSVFYNNMINAENQRNTYGGAVYWFGQNALINNSKFTYNWVYNKGNFSYGGALYLEGNYATVENSLFEDNMAIAYGGAIYLKGYAGAVYNSTFNRNRVGTEGGALFVNSEDFVINKSTFTKNNATYLGGAIALDEPGTIDNSTFTENNANKGGAIYWDALKGNLKNSNFYNNSAYYAGGAFACDYHYPHAEKLIENCLFEENSCHNYGGAIASLNSEIVNSTFKNNKAHIGEAVHSYSSKISPDSKFENNDVVIQTSELIQITASIGNSTRETNTSYTAVCLERFTQFPHLGLKDDNLSRVINILTGNSIVDYLKILVSTYFNSTDDIFRYKNEKILFYSEADRDNPDHWNKLVYIPRIDYFSRAVHEFSDHDYWNSDHPLVLETLRLYDSVYGGGTKIPEKFIKEVNGSLVEFDFSSMISPTSQSLFLFKMIKHNMSVQKIALNKTVYLGNQTMFKIVVTNNGESNLTDIKVNETEYDGLKLVGYVADNLWTGNIQTGEFIYTGILKPGDNASFIVIFDTLKKGNFTNVVVGSSNKTTNKTTNNTTEVVPIRVNVTKIWNDVNNNDGLRPNNVTIYLFADGVKINETVLSEKDNWNFIFNDLPMVKNGKIINYTVSEKPIDGYTMKIINKTVDDFTVIIANNTYNFDVVNNHTPLRTSVNVTKVWDDDNNRDGVRPVSVVVNLLADGKINQTVVLNASNSWKYTFANLLVYNNGKKIKYNFSEDVVDKYTVSYDNKTVDNFTITNTHVPEVTSVNVAKVWVDDGNRDGFRTEITVELYANGLLNDSFVLSDDNNWKHTFAGLFVYANGEKINYSVREVGVNADKYDVVITNDTMYDFIITNTHVPEVTSVNVAKVWVDDGNRDGVRPVSVVVNLLADGVIYQTVELNESNNWAYYFTDLYVYKEGKKIKYNFSEEVVDKYTVSYANSTVDNFTITNTHIPERTSVNVTKVWKDDNNQDGVRPSSVTVVLVKDGDVVGTATLNASNNWSVSFKDLPVYSNGQLINYTIDEVDVANYTSVVISNDSAYSFTVTNTHVPVVTSVDVIKVWNDINNQDGVRSVGVSVVLIADGDVVGTVTLDDSNAWKHTFENLPVYSNGQLINYTIDEVDVANYTSVVSNNATYSFTVTNTHVPVVTSVDVIKVWNDANNQDGLRPAAITVVLIADGDVVGTAVLDASNGWNYTFENLPVYDDGELIKYSVEEISVANYTSSVSNVSAYSFIVNNVHVPLITVVNITKVWGDGNNNDEKPVEVIIYADGVKVANVTLNPSNISRFIFDNLPVYKDGKVINYTIGVVDGNRIVNLTKSEGNFTIMIEPEYHPDMSVRKITLDKKVRVGQQVSFRIVVKNTGDCNLTGVYVIDSKYSEGLVLDHMLPNADWTYVGDGKFVYGKTLGVGESASFIVVFNTTSVGFKVNSVIAGNNITNDTVNSTNTTRVVNDTVPNVPVNATPKHPVPHKHHVPKHVKQDKYATGNPIALLLLALFIPLIRRKQK